MKLIYESNAYSIQHLGISSRKCLKLFSSESSSSSSSRTSSDEEEKLKENVSIDKVFVVFAHCYIFCQKHLKTKTPKLPCPTSLKNRDTSSFSKQWDVNDIYHISAKPHPWYTFRNILLTTDDIFYMGIILVVIISIFQL